MRPRRSTRVLATLLIAGWSSVSGASVSVAESELDFAMGTALFDRPWTMAPSVTKATDGLGPLFNARSCVACHTDSGRGDLRPDETGHLRGRGFVMRIGNGDGQPDPVYGRQLQTNTTVGIPPEGKVYLEGNRLVVKNMAYGALAPDSRMAGRLSQPLHGLGLLERVSTETLLALADPEDRDGDGISGRPNIVGEKDGQPIIGRFTWKGAAPDLRTQAANAFKNDIGMSTPIHSAHAGDCTAPQTACLQAPHGGEDSFDQFEISAEMLRLVTVYLQGLKPPTSIIDPAGLDVFKAIGCADCHVPSLPMDGGGKVQAFSDLLLHDMGDDLADGIREGDASGREWRTQPLWGSARAQARGQRFLHDGRATTLDEAIRFHGGEARQARDAYKALDDTTRLQLIQFLSQL